MKSIQTFLEEFNCIPFEEKATILLQAWSKIFAIKHDQPEDLNESFQKLLEDLKELAEYKESLENSSKEIAVSNSNPEKEEPPQDSDIRQLIREECCVEVVEEKKQNMENTILELVEICRQKELLFMHDNVDDLIESALNSKLLSINSQLPNKKKQEVKNVVEQPVERGNRIIQSLQNFRVIHKSSTFLKDTSQISPVHAITPILSTEEPEHPFSMGYEHLSTTPETELDKVTESSAKNLLPIPRECEVTSEDESKCDMPIQDQSSSVFTTFSNPLFKDNNDLDSSDDESLFEEDVPIEESKVYSYLLFDDDEINSNELESHVEYNLVESPSNHDALIDSSQKIDYLEEFSGELAHINPEIKEFDFDFEKEIRLIENLLYDNSSPRPPEELMRILLIQLSSLFPHLLFQFRMVILKGKRSILLPKRMMYESSDSDHQDEPSFPRPPPEPPDTEPDSKEEIPVVMYDNDEFECLYPRNENDKDDDYFPFMIVIRIFMPYLIYSKVFSFLLSAKSEDTIFDLGKDYAQNVKNQSKTGQYRTQDWKSTAKAGSTSNFSQRNQAMKLKCQKNLSSGINLANCSKCKSLK
nr:hypothetical protein [Tanacetum cinerariifolium]